MTCDDQHPQSLARCTRITTCGSTRSRRRHPAADGVVVRIEAGMVLSYTGKVLSGSVPYSLPPMPFVPGTNAIARVLAAGDNVTHVEAGDRVFLSPHLRGDVPDREPPQILIGFTAMAHDAGGARAAGAHGATACSPRWRIGLRPASRRLPVSTTDRRPSWSAWQS